MKNIITFLITFCLCLTCVGQKNYLTFQKKANRKQILVPLPHFFDITTKNNTFKFGEAFSQTDSTIMLTYHDVDSVKWAKITSNLTFTRKIKIFKIDSLYKADSVIYSINKMDIAKIKFGVAKVKPRKYEVFFWTSMTLMVAAGVTMITAVGTPPNDKTRVLRVLPYPLTIGLMFYATKKRIRTDKWDIK